MMDIFGKRFKGSSVPTKKQMNPRANIPTIFIKKSIFPLQPEIAIFPKNIAIEISTIFKTMPTTWGSALITWTMSTMKKTRKLY